MVSVRAKSGTGNRSSAKRFLRCAHRSARKWAPHPLHSKGWEATISDSQSIPNMRDIRPGNAHHLITRLSAADNLNRRRWHIEQLRKEPNQRLIGPALNRRSSQRDLQYLVSQNARNRRSAGPRLHPYLKTHPSRRFAKRNHAGFGREPKIAVPIRTSVDPSSMAISKSPDIPIDSSPKSSPGYRAANLSRS